MPVSFPTNPTVGQTYTFGGVTWQWNGTTWVNAASGTAFVPVAGGVNMTGPLGLAGVTNGGAVGAGQVGEVVTASGSATVGNGALSGSGIVMTLSAGIWMVHGQVSFSDSGNQITVGQAWIATTAEGTTVPSGTASRTLISFTGGAMSNVFMLALPMRYFNITAPGTLNVVGAINSSATGNTLTLGGQLIAARIA